MNLEARNCSESLTKLGYRIAHRFHSMKYRPVVPAFSYASLGIVVVSACTTAALSGDGNHDASGPLGSFTLSGPTLGQQALFPTACVTGERQFFLGFDLHDKKAGVVTRLVVDPVTGPIVRVFATSAPFDKTILFRRPDCRVFRFSLDLTGWRVDRSDQLNVSVELDCHLPSGEGIVGKAADSKCL
jgi:hypothetical protein